MRVGQPAYIKSLDFVPLGKLRKEHSGDANSSEKTAVRSVLGALGYLAREGRPDPVVIQISHCPYAKPLWIKSALCLMEMPVVETPVLNEHNLGMCLCLLTGRCWKDWQLL